MFFPLHNQAASSDVILCHIMKKRNVTFICEYVICYILCIIGTSRENSIISKRANAKPPRETSLLTKSIANIKSSNGSSTILTKPPSRDEKRHNEMVIDVVAALNDPKKNNGETEQDHAFITEKTTLTESTVAAVEKS